MRTASAVRPGLGIALAAAVGVVLGAGAARAQISGRDTQALAGKKLIYIATVRKNGSQSTAAPVWFTLSADRKQILIQTGPKTWKARRIRRGSPVMVWIGVREGPAFIGTAQITQNTVVQDKILADYRQKYMLNRLMGVGPSRAKFDSGSVIAIVITPVRDLPEGFKSAPGTSAPPLAPASGGQAKAP